MARITPAGRRLLAEMPDDWTDLPLFLDGRSLPRLVKSGLLAERTVGSGSAARVEWRRTIAGRAAANGAAA